VEKKRNWKERIRDSFSKSTRFFWKNSLPILSTILLVNLLVLIIPPFFYKKIFTGNYLIDPIIGAIIGSISAGNPIISYIIAGELKKDVSLTAVTAFIVAWVTVGIIQLPAESMLLGRKFAIVRNITAFILAILVAIATVWLYNLI
jgi:uncharacterized membrane protein YraQ (UPF0718 family)